MATIVTHQPRPVPALGRQHSACITYSIPNQSQSSFSFLSSMDLYPRSYRPNRPPHFPPSLSLHHHRHYHHSPHTPPYYSTQHRSTMTPAAPVSYPTTPPMTTDIQHDYPFDISFATGSGMSFAELDLSQAAFLNPGQLPWSESDTDFKVECPPVPQPVFYADPGSYAFYNDSAAGPAQLFPAQPQSSEADLDLRYPSPPPAQNALGSSVAPIFVQPSEVMPPSPPTFATQVPFPRAPGSESSSPPGLIGESDEDIVSESGESEAVDPSDAAEGDDDGDFTPSCTSFPRTRSRRTSSVSVSSGSGSVRAARSNRLGAPVPVPNLTKKSRGRRVPTAPVFIVQGGVQKNMRMYKCNVEGCCKCFARGEHLKRHVRSIHTNEKPHKCPVEGCGKDFSRHDNLGQHMRVHKGQAFDS